MGAISAPALPRAWTALFQDHVDPLLQGIAADHSSRPGHSIPLPIDKIGGWQSVHAIGPGGAGIGVKERWEGVSLLL